MPVSPENPVAAENVVSVEHAPAAVSTPANTPSSIPAPDGDDFSALQKVPLFEGLSESELAQIRALMTPRDFAPGETIIREGEPGDEFFITLDGRTRCIVLDAGGEEIILAESGEGSFFGELSMLTGEARAARITALTEVTTLVLDRDGFLRFLHTHPRAAVNALLEMAKRLHRADALLRSSVSRNVNEVAEEELTWGQRVAEKMAGFIGRLSFLIFHLIIAVAWIAWNHPDLGGHDFDPYPFNFLSMTIGFEALLFSILVLNSQARQEAKDRIAEEIHHEINKKAEMEVSLILRRLDDLERSAQHANDEHQELLLRALTADTANNRSSH